jgi:hypothetical protein
MAFIRVCNGGKSVKLFRHALSTGCCCLPEMDGCTVPKMGSFFFEELAGALLCHIRRRASQSFTESYYIKKQKTQALKTLEGNCSFINSFQ